MDGKQILPTDLTPGDYPILNETPKCVLYAIAKHLAALATEEEPDKALQSGAYIERIYQEWDRLHSQGIVLQAPPLTPPSEGTSASTGRR